MADSLPQPIRLGVSACLAGERVRYDGREKEDTWVTGTLARHFALVPVCPEVGIGLGVPRPPLRLEGSPAMPRAVGVTERQLDVTAPLRRFGREAARELHTVSGFILKSRSPSCGMGSVPIHGPRTVRHGNGLFARELLAAQPLLPVVEEGDLAEAAGRDHFLERVFAYRRWQELEAQGITAHRLLQFHARHKLQLMAHSPTHYRLLGRLLGDARRRKPTALAGDYARGFAAALALCATPRKHANVLQHLMGYLKTQLDGGDKAELLEAIDGCRLGQLPLLVPLTLLRHHFRRHPHEYVAGQLYLYPPEEEMTARFT